MSRCLPLTSRPRVDVRYSRATVLCRCKKDQFYECYSPALQFSIDTGYEFENCARHMPTCYKNREICLGSCGGEDVQLTHDFATTVIKRELSTETLGTDGVPKARANCTLKTQVVEVPVFEGGDSLKVYSSYLRVRSGMTAINPLPHMYVVKDLVPGKTSTYSRRVTLGVRHSPLR